MTAGMVNPATYSDCIHPNEVLGFIAPNRVELVLAYRAG